MSEPDPNPAGVITSLRRMFDTGLALIQDRLELLGVELRLELGRLVQVFLLAATLVAVGMLAMTLLTLLVVVYFWDSGRIEAIGSMILFYIIVGVVVWRRLSQRLNSAVPFAATLQEFEKDRECLGMKR